jgi:ribosomal protein S18 acetylase RimI-like enzyme
LDIFPERFWQQRNLLRLVTLGDRGRVVKSSMAGGTTEVMLCPPSQRGRALEILYRRVPSGLRHRLIANVLDEAEQRLVDLSGLWIAQRRGRILGALLTQPLAGRAAAVWAPEVDVTWWRSATAVALVRAALADLKNRGFIIAQALLDESAPRQGAWDLAQGGMPLVTELVYLERGTRVPLPVQPEVPALVWHGFEPATEADFRTVLQATYSGSLDMPELEGIRSLDDILASHRAGGRFVASRWQVGRVRSEPASAAVLLLSEIADRDAWEIAYLGLTPQARGRGLGRAVLAHALTMAAEHVPRLELAVDIRNHPATRLYRVSGFTPFDQRAVHLASLAEPAVCV